MDKLAIKAEEYARKCHGETNHMYDDMPYVDAHVAKVVEVGKRFKHLIPEEDWDLVECGLWTHDIIEDTRQTHNNVSKTLSIHVAELAYALTNEKGRTRKDRANEKYYEGIRDVRYADFCKNCDRIANVEHSLTKPIEEQKMLEMYKNEHANYVRELYNKEYDEMFKYMEKLFNL